MLAVERSCLPPFIASTFPCNDFALYQLSQAVAQVESGWPETAPSGELGRGRAVLHGCKVLRTKCLENGFWHFSVLE